MTRFCWFVALVMIGCSKPATTGPPSPAGPPIKTTAAAPPDLTSVGTHLKFLSTQSLADDSGKKLEVQSFVVDLGFEAAKKLIDPVLTSSGWTPFTPNPEKGVKEAAYANPSKGSYVLMAPASGGPGDVTTLAFTPYISKVTITRP